MKPAPFDYYAPESIEEALALLARLEDEDVDAKILAGGQSLMPMLSLRVARPEALIDLRKLSSLDYIREDNGKIAIGTMTSKSAAEDSDLIRTKQPLFHAATQRIGHRQIRNQGTVGGSFAHADPAAEYPAVALALDMEMTVVSANGHRVIPAADFFVTFLTTDIDSTEILTEVRMPKLPAACGWSFQELSRRDGDFALAGAAVTMSIESGKCANARVVAFGINATAVRLQSAEQAVNGEQPGEAIFALAGSKAAEAVDEPLSDVHASAAYRRHLVQVMVSRGLAEAAMRAGGKH